MISYVVLVSKFIEHFDVDFEGELIEIVKSHNKINCATMCKIRLKKVNDEHWIRRVEEEARGQ